MMQYADAGLDPRSNSASGQKLAQVAPSQPVMIDMLSRVGAINERLSLSADRLWRFLDRCHGPRPQSNESGLDTVPSGHFDAFGNQMRLAECHAAELESIADALDRIG